MLVLAACQQLLQHCLTLALSTSLQGLEGPNWWELVAPEDKDTWRRHAGCEGVEKYLYTPHFKDLQVGQRRLGGISQAQCIRFCASFRSLCESGSKQSE
jgi:hypothetical protein